MSALVPLPQGSTSLTTVQLPALRLVQSSQTASRTARSLLLLLALAIIAMCLLPWQQSARGTGKVVAYAPQERQQTVESPVKGIVKEVAKGLFEGSRVTEGQFILEIQPQAADLVEQLESQKKDLLTKVATAQAKAEAYGLNIVGFEDVRLFAVAAAEDMVLSSRAKLKAKEDSVPGYEAKEWQARLNYDRQKGLADQGLKPPKEIEKLKKELDVAVAELAAIRSEVESLREDVEAKENQLKEKRAEAQTKIEYARAMQQDALGQMATAQKELRDVEIKLSELSRLRITAPRDGTIFRMPVYERGQTVKEFDPLFTIVPDTTAQAVELLIAGNDTPLIKLGDDVRLQFEGWPAIQFAGWPSVAKGTFGGKVVAVDATDDGKGKFRILVRPEQEEPWPTTRLRQGVRANGWVMLRQVKLGYEIWRQLNGFPPVVAMEEPKDKPLKAPKLPK